MSNSTGGELLEDEAVGLEEEAFFNLPEDVVALSSERPALAYVIQRGRWRLACDIVLASEVKMPPTIIDRAAHTIVRRADGNIIARTSLEVRNRDRQFIRVRMPKGAKVLVALVDDKSVAITKGAAGEFILPLKKSIATVGGLVSFPVEIIYTQTSPGLGLRGELEHLLPRVDAPIAHTTCDLYLPDEFAFLNWRGPLEHVAPAEAERPRESMVIGRAHKAEPTGWLAPFAPFRLFGFESRSARLYRRAKADEARLKAEALEAAPPAPAKPDPDMVANNYYRAAVEAYNRKDLDKARGLLERTIKTAPKSVAARNAKKLKTNIATVIVVDKSSSSGSKGGRFGRARRQTIQKQVRSGEEDMLLEQRHMLRRADELAQGGQRQASAETYGGVIALADELRKRGQDTKELRAIVGRARSGLREQLAIQDKATRRAQKLGETRERVARARQAAQQGQRASRAAQQAAQQAQRSAQQFSRQVKEQEDVVRALKELLDPEARPGGKAKEPRRGAEADKRVLLQKGRRRARDAEASRRPNLQAISNASLEEGAHADIFEEQTTELEGELSELKKELAGQEKTLEAHRKALRELQAAQRRNRKKEEAEANRLKGLRADSQRKGADRSAITRDLATVKAKLEELLAHAREEEAQLRKHVMLLEAPMAQLTQRIRPEPGSPGQRLRTAGTQIEVESEVEQKWKRDIEAKLDELVSFDLIDTPLDDVVALFRSLKQVNIVVDKKAAEGRGSLGVTLRLEKVKFKDALDWICRLTDLVYTVRDNAIFITSRARMAELDQKRTVHYDARAWKPFKDKLNEPVSFDCIATPLDDVVAFLGNLKGVNIVVDKKAIEGRKDLDVTLRLDKVAFRDALAWICRDLDLGYTVRGGAIFISTPDDRLLPRGKTVTRFYDVTDLTIDVRDFRPDSERGKQEGLTKFITENIDSATWNEDTFRDRGNTIAYRNGKLVITHTPEVQVQIHELLMNVNPNRGQQVNVHSANTVYFDSHVKFITGKNDAQYAVVDEGQLRQLMDAGQRHQRARPFEENPTTQDVAVGNKTTIANYRQINIVGSDTGANRFDYLDNAIRVPHGKYLLINNDNNYVTIIGSTEKYHWTERIEPRRVVTEVAPRIDLPLAGRVVKFEKTLIEPEDEPVLRADYVMAQE